MTSSLQVVWSARSMLAWRWTRNLRSSGGHALIRTRDERCGVAAPWSLEDFEASLGLRRWESAIELRDVLRRELDAERLVIFADVRLCPSTRNRDRARAQHPGECELCGRHLMALRNA